MDKTIRFENNGVVDSKFWICDSCNLYVQNAGVFSADIIYGNNSFVYQVVHSTTDLNKINIDTTYDLVVSGAVGVNLDDVLRIKGVNVRQIIVQDSVINMDGARWSDLQKLDLMGQVVFVADDLSGVYDVPLAENVRDDVIVEFESANTDAMFANRAYIDDGKLFVKLVRETDYVKVLGGDVGRMLNDIRIENADDALLKNLDVAKTRDEIWNLIRRSARFNTDILRDVVRSVANVNAVFDDETGVTMRPAVALSNDWWGYGVGFSFMEDVGHNLKLGIGGGVGSLQYASYLDTFDGNYITGNLYAKYGLGIGGFVRSEINTAIIMTDIKNALYDGRRATNPYVWMIENNTDAGYKIGLGARGYVAPFVGIGTDMVNVSDRVYNSIAMRVGTDVGFESDVIMGVRYRYGARITGTTGMDAMLSGYVGFWSEYDAVGGNIELSVYRIDDMTSTKISIGASLLF